MLVDQLLILAEKQKLSAAAAGTKVIDFGQKDSTAGFSKHLIATCVVAAKVTGTLQFKLQECDTESGSYTDCASSGVFSAPEAGTVIQIPMPYHTKRYVKAYFGGAPTAGTVNAFLTEGRQQWNAEAQAPAITKAPVVQGK